MSETEVKVLDVNQEELIQKLEALGAEKVFDGKLHAVAFDFPDKKLKEKRILLRLRDEVDKITLGFKKMITQEGAKIMDEHEVVVSDWETTQKILEGLGMEIYHESKKKRISYKLGDVRFDFDTREENIPTYLEIEAPSVHVINEFVDKLGLDKNKVKPWTFAQVEKHYKLRQ